MTEAEFDPTRFYESYPAKVIARPGYPARAAFKSTLFFGLYGELVLRDLGTIDTYADIGGCFGFGANSMAFQIAKRQGSSPRTLVFEISPGFVEMGRSLFPNIEFVEAELGDWEGDIARFDLVSLFDVVEHIVDPGSLLRDVSARSRYVMLKTPMETAGPLRGDRPRAKRGEAHVDGHVSFFAPEAYEELLTSNGLEIVESRLVRRIYPSGAHAALQPESPHADWRRYARQYPVRFILKAFPGIPWRAKRMLFGGGDHICLCRSRSTD